MNEKAGMNQGKRMMDLMSLIDLMDLVEDDYIEEAAAVMMKESQAPAAGAASAASAEDQVTAAGAAIAASAEDQVRAAGAAGLSTAGARAGEDDQAERAPGRKSAGKNTWKKWTALVACLCLVVAGAAAWSANVLFVDDLGRTEGSSQAAASAVGVAIPEVKLPKKTDGAAIDMLALVAYQGNVYLESGDLYTGQAAEAIYGLVDQCVGYGTGNIDEWSGPEDYKKEFSGEEWELFGEDGKLPGLAGTVSGKVYQVKGYDPDFRLCMVEEFEKEDGTGTELVISFLERLNGITVTTGQDLFGDRLHLAENQVSVEQVDHQTWFSWDYEKGGDLPKTPLGISEENWGAFLDALYAGKFEDLTGTEIYDRITMHLYVHMKDHTVVSLWISEDGYVIYDGLPWYGVKVSGEELEQILALG